MENKSLRNRFEKLIILLLTGFIMIGQLLAQAQNLDKEGVAIQGYDPVAFFTAGKPIKGNPAISSKFDGAIYQFSSQENKVAFEKSPKKYIPQFGGYCAYGVAKGGLSKIDVDAFQIVGGRLLLQYSAQIRNEFNKDTIGLLKKADANWPTVSNKNP